jgi:uncharacterized protein (DUF1499 family)
MKKMLITLGVLLVAFAVAIFLIGRTLYPDHIAETSTDGGKKDLKTRFYKSDPETVKKSVREIIPTLSTYGNNWKIVNDTDGEDTFSIKAEVPVIVFTDDIEIKIKKADNLHEIRVDAVSKSRVGQSDFGENARHVRQILNALDEKLGKK